MNWHKIWRGLSCITLALTVQSGMATVAGESDESVEALRQAAREALGGGEGASEKETETTFTSGALGLQALNPEISITGDFLGTWRSGDAVENESDFFFRGLGIHLESELDPYSRFKAAVSFNETDATLGEAYFTRHGVLPGLNLTLGKFRQPFGVVNRWHKHALDQVDFPLALRQIFGESGLNQTGISAEWTGPDLAGLSQVVVLQLTDGDNGRVFGENADNAPSGLARYRLYRDISASTYAEVGATALTGQNNQWVVGDAMEEKDLPASVFGIDFTVAWEPTRLMRYRNVTWRSEAYVLDKEVLAPDGSGEDSLQPWGAYTYLESKITRTVILGTRLDYFEPDSKAYADDASSLAPLAVAGVDPSRWQVTPYLTWHQSPWVHFRLEYNHQDGDETGPSQDMARVQCIFAAGPHKHERY